MKIGDAAKSKLGIDALLDFSGVIFGSYGYRTDSAAKASLGSIDFYATSGHATSGGDTAQLTVSDTVSVAVV